MPVKRRAPKARSFRVTEQAVTAYRRMREIEAMDLPNGHPLLRSDGEYTRVRHEVHKATGALSWNVDDPDVAGALDEIHEATDLPRALVEKLKQAEQRRLERECILEADFVLNGPHCVGWNQEKEESDFEAEWGVRPQAVDRSGLDEVKAHVYGLGAR